jgi:hypothetical protein
MSRRLRSSRSGHRSENFRRREIESFSMRSEVYLYFRLVATFIH